MRFFPPALFSCAFFFRCACFRCAIFQCAFFLEPTDKSGMTDTSVMSLMTDTSDTTDTNGMTDTSCMTYKVQGHQKCTKLPIRVRPWYTRMYRWELPEVEVWSRVKLASTPGKFPILSVYPPPPQI